jgi:16S rRNA (guanine527-N7)-methyltransferase
MEYLSGPGFCDAAGVSRETYDKLSLYVSLLTKWQEHINLVSPGSLKDVWRRHMFDSAQLLSHVSGKQTRLVDLGSGAGFPGLVLSILGVADVVLVESNQKKCSFLKEVARQTASHAAVFVGRVEEYPEFNSANYITSRALASLDVLLLMSHPLLANGGRCLFLKGKSYEQELTQSRKRWNMDVTIHPSNAKELETRGVVYRQPSYGVLLEIRNLSPRGQ